MSVQEFRRCFSPDGLTLLSSEQCCYRGSKQQTVSSTHPVHKIDSPHCADLGRVIDEADVSLCGSVQLSDLNVPEAIYELWPNVRSDPVADGDSHFVVLLSVFLQRATSTQIKKTDQGDTKLI